jgi:hypothetical protein
LLRRELLGGIGGYRATLTQDGMLTNLIKGPSQTLFLQPVGSWGTAAQAWGMTAALVLGLVLGWRRSDWRRLFLIGLGVLMVFLFDLPFALITKREQYYALTLGAVLAFAACSDVVVQSLWPRVRPLAMLLFAIIVATMSQRSAAARDLYAPFSDSTLATDRFVEDWAAVPSEIREWLHRKITTRQVSSLSRDLPYAVFGAGDLEKDPRGNLFRWTGKRVWIYAKADARRVTFTLRAGSGERPSRPFIVDVSGGHTPTPNLRLEPGQQQVVEVDFRRLARLPGSMPFVRIDIDHTWTPGAHDTRRLGVILSDLTLLDRGPAMARASVP